MRNPPARAFLAAHLFGSWAAYQNGGLSAIVQDVRRALTVLRRETESLESFVEAARAADLRLRHAETEIRIDPGNFENW